MTDAPRWAYVTARLMARFGMRPDAGAWRAIEATPDAASYVAAARKTAFAPWLEEIDIERSAAGVEQQLRVTWSALVRQLADLPPESWRAAISWLTPLAYLSLIDALLSEDEVPDRWCEDPVLGRIAAADRPVRSEALAELGWGPLAGDERAAEPISARWWRELRVRAPSSEGDDERALSAWGETLHQHREVLRATSGAATEARRRLEAALVEGLRRHRSGPGALLFYLALCGFDLQRLRAGVVIRLELPHATEGRAWV